MSLGQVSLGGSSSKTGEIEVFFLRNCRRGILELILPRQTMLKQYSELTFNVTAVSFCWSANPEQHNILYPREQYWALYNASMNKD